MQLPPVCLLCFVFCFFFSVFFCYSCDTVFMWHLQVKHLLLLKFVLRSDVLNVSVEVSFCKYLHQ